MSDLKNLSEAIRHYLAFEEAHGIGGDLPEHEPEFSRLMEVVEEVDPKGKQPEISTEPTHCHCGEKLVLWSERESGECVHHIEEAHQLQEV